MLLLQRTMVVNSAMSRMFQLVLIVILLSSAFSMSITRHLRVRKNAADQRLVELQALLALAKNLPDFREQYGHGHVNPFAAGRRKRYVEAFANKDAHSPIVSRNFSENSISQSATGSQSLMSALVELRRRQSLSESR